MRKITILMLCIAVFISMANARNIFVDPTDGIDNLAANDGTNWSKAVKTLAGAINATYTSFAAGDNIYVKGGTLTFSAAFTSNATANYYGSCDLSNTGTSTTRTLVDKDGNGIIEPWEFLNPTQLYSTASIASGGTGNVTAFTLGGNGYTFDGFTITHVGSNASTVTSPSTTPFLRSIWSVAGTKFTNNSIKYSVVTFTPTTVTAATLPYEMFFKTNGASVSNCLFEKNKTIYNTNGTSAAYPFIMVNSSFSNCIVRDNLVTVNASGANAVRSMLIGISPTSAAPIATLKNCLIHNNEMLYNGTGSTTSNVGGAVNVYGNDGNDSILNCTIANNKTTLVPIAGMVTPSRTGTTNIIQNNVLWNNIYGTSTVANLSTGTSLSAISSISKNLMNGGQTVTENGTTIKYNDFTLSNTNNTGANQPLFKTPTTIIGSSLGSLLASAQTDSTTIKQSVWRIKPGSYLVGKGVQTPTNLTDKSGNIFSAIPAIGAYEGLSAPTITGITPSSTQLSVAFTAGCDGGSTITNYKYSIDGGVNFTACSPLQTSGPIVITGLTNGTSYNVQIKATNAMGDGVATNSIAASPTAAAATAPAAPSINSITSGNTTLSIAFTPGSDNGSAIISYKYSTDGGSNWYSRQTGTTASPIVITGLSAGTAYNIQIKAVNAVNDGTATLTTTAYTLPDAPTISAITAGNAQVSVAFTAPTNSSTITSYIVSSSSGSNIIAVASPILLTGLTNENSNTYTVKAINAAGVSVASVGVSATPSASATLPNAPTALVATPSSTSTIIAFTAPTLPAGLSIADYKYSLNGGAWTSSGRTASPVTISGLTDGATYTISLKANTSAGGDGLAATAITSTYSAPSAPTITGITATNGQLSVAFTAGSANGYTISNYQYSLNGGTFTQRSSGTTASPIAITVTNGTLYNVQIKAVYSNNGGGVGAASATYTAPVYSTTPAAPSISAITAGVGQLSVAFTAGSNGGSTITNYKYSTDGGSTFALASTTSSPLIISTLSTDGTTLLTNGTSYNVQIKAVNANGDGTATASTAAAPLFAAPTSTAASSVTSTGFTANWTAAATQGPSATYTYTLQYGTVADLSSGTSSIPSISSSAVSQAVSCFAATTYYYRVMATNGTVSSAWSAIQTLTTTGTRTLWSQDLTGLKLGDSPVTLTATTSALTNPAPITYLSSNTAVVSVSGNTLTVVGPGTATVTAQQAANADNEAAADVVQNVTVSIINTGFEDTPSSFTVTESSLNVLRRVAVIQNATTEAVNPTTTATTVTSGMWVKKAPNTTYVKGIVTTTDPHSGTSCMNFTIGAGTPNTNYDNWTNNIVLQKLSLTNTQKYIISFWAKKDATGSNVASTVTAFLTDNTKRTNLSCAIPLTGGTTWTQYSATFDIPTFKAANATADFTTAFVGIGLTTTYNATTFKTNYSGVLIDDVAITPTSATTVAITATAGTGGTVTNGGVYVSGTNATVVAAPTPGYKFVNWTENGAEVTTNASFSFNVSAARSLLANFIATTVPVSTTALSGFSYYSASGGPSTEQTFTVSGTNLTSNIVLTAPTDYAISNTTGTGFGSSITLTPIGGTVATTTIYVRLKAGLAINSYNAENITVAAYGMTTQNVACSGNVTQITPTLTVSGAQSYTFTGLPQGPATVSYNGDGTTSLLYTSTDGGGYSASAVPTNAGTYQVVASATAGTNYTAATSSAYTFTIYSTGNISSDTNVSALTLSAASNLSVATGNTLTIDAATTVNSVTVASGAKLTLNAGKTLNTASITLQSDASGTATLTDSNSNGGLIVSGTSTVQQYLSGARNWYVSSPVAGSAVPVSGYTFYSRNEPAASWTTLTSDSILKAGRGYIANLLSGTATYNFSGTINSGDKNVSLFYSNGATKAGFNLIGNPYPSHYSVSKSQTDAANALNTIWYRTADWVVDNVTPSNSKYVYTFQTCLMQPNGSIIGTPDGTSNIIPPMQAFWVRTSVNGSTFSFANANRSHQASNMFKSAAKKDQNQPLIRLQASNGMVSDEAVIYSNADATDGLDAYDAIKMNNNSASVPEIYTVLDNQQIAINGMNTIPYNSEIPLGFTTGTAGNFSIKASQLANLVAGTQVVLKDYQDISNPVTTDLTDGSSYAFSSPVTTNNSSRFALIFKAPSMTTGINPAESDDVWISTRNGEIMINGVNGNGARLEVYNAIGQKVLSTNLTDSTAQLNTKFIAGAYLVKLSSNGHSVIKKVIID